MTRLVASRFVTAVPNPTVRGLLALLATGLLWGLVVIGPELVPDASATSIVGGRFVVLGAVSFVAARGRFVGVPWKRAFAYAFAGFTGFYLLMVIGVQKAGAAPIAAIIGLTPVLYAIAGARAERLDLRRLAGPLAVLLIGLGAVHVVDLREVGHAGSQDLLVGLGFGLASTLVWLWYGLDNGRYLRSNHVNNAQWTNAVGLAAGILGVPFLLHGVTIGGGVGSDAGRWAVVVVVLGVGSAWLGTVAWNAASKLLPESLLGPLLVVELLIGVSYAHLLAGSWPSPATLAGYALLVAGVVLSVRTADRLRTRTA